MSFTDSDVIKAAKKKKKCKAVHVTIEDCYNDKPIKEKKPKNMIKNSKSYKKDSMLLISD